MAVELSNVKIINSNNRSSSKLFPHEQFEITYNLNNNTSLGIERTQICLIYDYQGSRYYASGYYYDNSYVYVGYGRVGSFNSNKPMLTFQNGESTSIGTNLYTWMNNQNVRSIQSMQVRFVFTFSDGSTSQQIITPSPAMGAVNIKMQPQIKKLNFKRCDQYGVIADDGEYVLATIQTEYANSSYYNKLPLVVEKRIGSTVQTTKTFSTSNSTDLQYLSNFVNGVTDSDIFISTFPLGVFSANNNYIIKVSLGDEYEKSTLQFVVRASFVNVHLSSASSGGVAFGKLSSATDNNPKFECEYPTTLDNQLSVTGNVTFHNSLVERGNIYMRNNTTNVDMMTISSKTGSVQTRGDISVGGNLSSTSGNISTTNGNISGNNGSFNTLTTPKISGNNGSIEIGYSSSDYTTIKGFLSVGGFRNIRCGIGSAKECGANQYVDYTISFNPVFINDGTTPIVVATPYNFDSEVYKDISCCVMYSNSAGTQIRVYNNSSNSHTISIFWMAYGTAVSE